MAARGRQHPACGGQQRAVTRSQLRALDLTTQNVQLMAQLEQLDVLDVDASAAAKQQLQQRHEEQVDDRQDHRAILSGTAATPTFQGRPAFWHPSRRPGSHKVSGDSRGDDGRPLPGTPRRLGNPHSHAQGPSRPEPRGLVRSSGASACWEEVETPVSGRFRQRTAIRRRRLIRPCKSGVREDRARAPGARPELVPSGSVDRDPSFPPALRKGAALWSRG
jgi:hypothetical protein